MIGLILSPIRKVLAWIGGALLILGTAWLAGRKSAKDGAKVDALQQEVKAHEIRNEVENRIAAADAHKRLHDEWSR